MSVKCKVASNFNEITTRIFLDGPTCWVVAGQRWAPAQTMRIESRGSQAEPAGTQCACAAVSCELSNPVSQLVSSRAENRSYIQFVVICKVGSTFPHTRRGPSPPCCSTPPWQWAVAWPMSCVTPSHGRILNSTGMPAGGSCGSRGPGAGGQASSAVFGVGECGGPGPGRTGAGRLESGLAPPPLLLG